MRRARNFTGRADEGFSQGAHAALEVIEGFQFTLHARGGGLIGAFGGFAQGFGLDQPLAENFDRTGHGAKFVTAALSGYGNFELPLGEGLHGLGQGLDGRHDAGTSQPVSKRHDGGQAGEDGAIGQGNGAIGLFRGIIALLVEIGGGIVDEGRYGRRHRLQRRITGGIHPIGGLGIVGRAG